MRKIFLTIGLFFPTLLFATEGTLKPADFAYGQKIILNDQASIYKATLPDLVYQSITKPDFGDMRVFNSTQNIVPHTLISSQKKAEATEISKQLPFYPIESGNESEGDVEFEYNHGVIKTKTSHGKMGQAVKLIGYIMDASELKEAPFQMEFSWEQNNSIFMTLVSIKGSFDLKNWESVVSQEALVSMKEGDHALEKRVIDFPVQYGGHYKYYRLDFSADRPSFSLRQVIAKLRKQALVDTPKILTVVGNRIAEKNEYVFEVKGVYPMMSAKIILPENNTVLPYNLYTASSRDGQNKKRVSSGFAYKLVEKDHPVFSPLVEMTTNSDRFYIVEFEENESGVGSGDVVLELGYYPHELVFLAQGQGPFNLAYGSVKASAAQFKVESILGSPDATLGKQNIMAANLDDKVDLGGPTQLLPALPEKKSNYGKFFLWACLVSGVGILFWMSRGLLKDMKN